MKPTIERFRNNRKRPLSPDMIINYALRVQKTTSGVPNPTNDPLLAVRAVFHQPPCPQEHEFRRSKLHAKIILPSNIAFDESTTPTDAVVSASLRPVSAGSQAKQSEDSDSDEEMAPAQGSMGHMSSPQFRFA
jgi:hypothetical protein